MTPMRMFKEYIENNFFFCSRVNKAVPCFLLKFNLFKNCFRLTSKLFLPTTPGESYDLTVTLNSRGSNPLSRTISGVLFHTYPSTISENATLREATTDSIVVDYSTIGIFAVCI